MYESSCASMSSTAERCSTERRTPPGWTVAWPSRFALPRGRKASGSPVGFRRVGHFFGCLVYEWRVVLTFLVIWSQGSLRPGCEKRTRSHLPIHPGQGQQGADAPVGADLVGPSRPL